MLSVENVPTGMGSFPLLQICASGSLPIDARDGIDVSWGRLGFCCVSQAAAVACIQLAGKEAKVRQSYELPKTEACSYMLRMNYCRVLGIERDEGFTRHDADNRFVPLSPIPIDEMEADVNELAARLRGVLVSNLQLSESARDMLDLSFGEVIDNVVQHSSAPAPGIACAQYHPSMGYVELCVADCGRGIAATMAENEAYAGISDAGLVEMAFSEHTGQWYGLGGFGTSRVSGGVGLTYPAALARKMGGHLWAVSRDNAVHIGADGLTHLSGLYYPGTILVLRIPNRPCEILESDIRPDGEPRPLLYKPGEGEMLGGGDGPLW